MIKNDDGKMTVHPFNGSQHGASLSDKEKILFYEKESSRIVVRIAQLEAENRRIRGSLQLIMNSCKSEECVATCANALDDGPETTVDATQLESAARELLSLLTTHDHRSDIVCAAKRKLESALAQSKPTPKPAGSGVIEAVTLLAFMVQRFAENPKKLVDCETALGTNYPHESARLALEDAAKWCEKQSGGNSREYDEALAFAGEEIHRRAAALNQKPVADSAAGA